MIYVELMNIYYYAVPLLIIALIVQVGYTMKLMSIMFGEVVAFNQSPQLTWSDLGVHEVMIALALIVPTWYLGVRGEHVIALLTQMDPILHHADYVASTTDVLRGVTDSIFAGEVLAFDGT